MHSFSHNAELLATFLGLLFVVEASVDVAFEGVAGVVVAVVFADVVLSTAVVAVVVGTVFVSLPGGSNR